MTSISPIILDYMKHHADKAVELFSDCCNAEDRATDIDGPYYSEIGICPECKEHCEFDNGDIQKLIPLAQML